MGVLRGKIEMDKIKVVCDACGYEMTLHTKNREETERKINSRIEKCPKCKNGRLEIRQ
jgi:Zn finger protein HypA/HybF involved in hydrogenase expression